MLLSSFFRFSAALAGVFRLAGTNATTSITTAIIPTTAIPTAIITATITAGTLPTALAISSAQAIFLAPSAVRAAWRQAACPLEQLVRRLTQRVTIGERQGHIVNEISVCIGRDCIPAPAD
jgi:hypothetical protein